MQMTKKRSVMLRFFCHPRHLRSFSVSLHGEKQRSKFNHSSYKLVNNSLYCHKANYRPISATFWRLYVKYPLYLCPRIFNLIFLNIIKFLKQ